MRFLILLFLIPGFVFSQYLTKHGEISNSTTDYINKYGKLGTSDGLTISGASVTLSNAYVFDPAAVSGYGINWPGLGHGKLYKNNYGGLSNSEFIDYALNLMRDTSSIHAMVLIYTDNSQQTIDYISAKYSVNTAYHKPSTITGQQVYVLSEYLASASANIGIAYTIHSFVVN